MSFVRSIFGKISGESAVRTEEKCPVSPASSTDNDDEEDDDSDEDDDGIETDNMVESISSDLSANAGQKIEPDCTALSSFFMYW